MAHFAQLDENSVVLNVIVIRNEDIVEESGSESEAAGVAFCRQLFGQHTRWVQTSYNASFRKNYATIGSVYAVERDAFIPPKIFDSWALDADTCVWIPPVPMPTDGKMYEWDEQSITWVATT